MKIRLTYSYKNKAGNIIIKTEYRPWSDQLYTVLIDNLPKARIEKTSNSGKTVYHKVEPRE